MINPNAKASRKERRSGGRYACSITTITPKAKPPTTAPTRLPIPPTTVAMKAKSAMGWPMVCVSVPVCETKRSDTAAARTPLIAKARPITKLASTPRWRAIRNSRRPRASGRRSVFT
jgi:hypothetical protein